MVNIGTMNDDLFTPEMLGKKKPMTFEEAMRTVGPNPPQIQVPPEMIPAGQTYSPPTTLSQQDQVMQGQMADHLMQRQMLEQEEATNRAMGQEAMDIDRMRLEREKVMQPLREQLNANEQQMSELRAERDEKLKGIEKEYNDLSTQLKDLGDETGDRKKALGERNTFVDYLLIGLSSFAKQLAGHQNPQLGLQNYLRAVDQRVADFAKQRDGLKKAMANNQAQADKMRSVFGDEVNALRAIQSSLYERARTELGNAAANELNAYRKQSLLGAQEQVARQHQALQDEMMQKAMEKRREEKLERGDLPANVGPAYDKDGRELTISNKNMEKISGEMKTYYAMHESVDRAIEIMNDHGFFDAMTPSKVAALEALRDTIILYRKDAKDMGAALTAIEMALVDPGRLSLPQIKALRDGLSTAIPRLMEIKKSVDEETSSKLRSMNATLIPYDTTKNGGPKQYGQPSYDE